RALALEIASLGEFNFLLSAGDWLFAHCSSRLSYIIRQAPIPIAHLADTELALAFNRVTQPSGRVAVIATTALTDNEHWSAFPPGNLLAFKEGLPVALGDTQTVAQDFPPRAASGA